MSKKNRQPKSLWDTAKPLEQEQIEWYRESLNTQWDMGSPNLIRDFIVTVDAKQAEIDALKAQVNHLIQPGYTKE